MKKNFPKKRSYRTFYVLLVIASLFTLTGTILSLTKLSTTDSLTSAATTSGTGAANISIQSSTSITNQVSNIDFGYGYVNASCNNCTIHTWHGANYTDVLDLGGQFKGGGCCFGFNDVTSGFLLENTGNENMSVNVSCTGNCTASTFIGEGSAMHIVVHNNSNRQQSGESGATDTAASCTTASDFYWGGWNITGNFDGQTDISAYEGYEVNPVDISGIDYWLCGNASSYPLSPDNTKDAGVLDLKIRIDSSVTGGEGEKTATFTFNAFSSG